MYNNTNLRSMSTYEIRPEAQSVTDIELIFCQASYDNHLKPTQKSTGDGLLSDRTGHIATVLTVYKP